MFGFKKAIISENPNGTFSFVGRVPVALGYERLDGSDVTEDDARDLAHVGPTYMRHRLTSRAWTSEENARAEADRLGLTEYVQ